ncbi:MAG: hypothetical protein GY757_62505, partial [bacterium]|nr:hypothetical protein [bacterium]
MTLVGIHEGMNKKFFDFMERYETILDYNGIDHIRLNVDQPDFWERVAELDLFIYRWNTADSSKQQARTILPVVEKVMGVTCFPNRDTCRHYDDKIQQYYILKQQGFPVVKTWVFWEKLDALAWLKTATFPLIFKLKTGSASHNVLMIETEQQARKLVKRMFGKGMITGKMTSLGDVRFKDFNIYKSLRRRAGRMARKHKGEDVTTAWQISRSYVLFQEFLPGNDYDTRVVVIGDRAFAFRRFNRKNDFRASGSSNKDLNPEAIDKEFLKIAFSISKKLKFQCMAYDFIYNKNK